MNKCKITRPLGYSFVVGIIKYQHHYQQDKSTAWYPSTLSRYLSMTIIAFDKSSWRHQMSVQSWHMKVFTGRQVKRIRSQKKRMLLTSLTFLLQYCSSHLAPLTWINYEIGGKWPYSCCLVGYFFQDLFKTACSILMYFLSSFFSMHFVRLQVVQPYSSTDIDKAWKNVRYILSGISDFHMVVKLLIADAYFS